VLVEGLGVNRIGVGKGSGDREGGSFGEAGREATLEVEEGTLEEGTLEEWALEERGRGEEEEIHTASSNTLVWSSVLLKAVVLCVTG